MKKLIIIFVLASTSLTAQPNNPDRKGNGCGQPPCNPAPTAYEWVLIFSAIALGGYTYSKKL